MHTEYLLVDYGGNGEAIEAVGEGFPKLDVVSSLTFVVKTVNSVDRCALVISSKQEKVLWVFDLVCQQKADGF